MYILDYRRIQLDRHHLASGEGQLTLLQSLLKPWHGKRGLICVICDRTFKHMLDSDLSSILLA